MRMKELGRLVEISRGSEGVIYRSLESGLCVKIFHSGVIADKKRPKIELMTKIDSLKARRDLSWPIDCIYNDKQEFIGYTMKCAPKGRPLSQFFNARMYQIDTYMLLLCAINFLKACKAIHDEGLVICDFNPNNFVVCENGDVFFVDVDNYQFKTKDGREFKADVACSEYLNKDLQELLGKAMTKKVKPSEIVPGFPFGSFNRRTDVFSMMIIVFRILMNGTHPFFGKGDGDKISFESNIYHGYAPYFGRGNVSDLGIDKPNLNILDRDLMNIFYNVFLGQYDPKNMEDTALEALHSYGKNLKGICSQNVHHHFRAELLSCPWCKLDAEKNAVINHTGSCIHTGNAKKNEKTVPVLTKRSNPIQSGGKSNPQSKSRIPRTAKTNQNNNSAITSYNLNQAYASQNRAKNKSFLQWIVFGIVCMLQLWVFFGGYVQEYYTNMGEIVILRGLVPYLFLAAGIITALFLTILFNQFELPTGASVILDMGTQIVAYAILRGVFAVFAIVASAILIILIFVAVIIILFGG